MRSAATRDWAITRPPKTLCQPTCGLWPRKIFVLDPFEIECLYKFSNSAGHSMFGSPLPDPSARATLTSSSGRASSGSMIGMPSRIG